MQSHRNPGQPVDGRAPEYAADFANLEAALAAGKPDPGRENPLHLSMHLSISEQCSIDQPRGIRQAVELLTTGAIRCTRPTPRGGWKAWAACRSPLQTQDARPTAQRMWRIYRAVPRATEWGTPALGAPQNENRPKRAVAQTG